ncbi:hypothetical protein M404DRAFT_1008032 [Pisolithus tinctorius Marx 270]|uniref:Uncharacterized protein n=1 Tax=Pisolithus tinctorius Marx 270 TaxID=870435 RepID=A0A0C3N133_PISTI|nr:hypothetical protein M404DRAFT_1008032 [Pisolithus tinctorius Marx 270]
MRYDNVIANGWSGQRKWTIDLDERYKIVGMSKTTSTGTTTATFEDTRGYTMCKERWGYTPMGSTA